MLDRKADHPDEAGQAGRRQSAAAADRSAQYGRDDRRPAGDPRDENETPEREAPPRGGQAGLTPISARVSVGVPASYLKKVWHERHPDPPGQDPATPDAAALDQIGAEESAKIRRHVAQLLPPTLTAADPAEQVTVTTFEDLQAPEPPPPGVAEQAWSWLAASWRTVGLAGLALVCLLWLRSAVRGGRASRVEQAATCLHVCGRRAGGRRRLASRRRASRPRTGAAPPRPTPRRSAGSFPSWSRPTPRRPQASSATGLDKRVDRWTWRRSDSTLA